MSLLTDKPLVSIVIPAHNVEMFVDQCVEAVLKQTHENIEVILVDDGSIDATPEKLDRYVKLDHRVKVIHQECSGPSGARNAGIMTAKGKYITFIDGDDYVTPVYVEQLLFTLVSSGRKISACDYSYDDRELSSEVRTDYRVYPSREAISEILRERDFQPSVWAKMFVSSIFEQVLFPEGMIYEDYYTAPRFYDVAGEVAYVKNKLYFYRVNRESITKSKFNRQKMQYFDVAADVNNYLEEHHPDLLDLAVSRDVNMTLGFCRKIAREKVEYAPEIRFMTGRIREGIGTFLKSSYPLSKKVTALGLASLPGLFMKLLAMS